MADVVTQSSALSAALTFRVQKKVLENLRAALVYADPAFSESGEFDSGHNQLLFISVPDLSINTTPLTEGIRPDKRALSMTTVTVATTQYGDLVAITDVAKAFSPFDISNTAAERISQSAKESIDQIVRDVIAAGGTAFYAGVGNPANRAAIAVTDLMRSLDLRKLRAKMYKAKVPVFADGYYRIMVSPDQGFDLRNDGTANGNWYDVNKYTNNEPLLKGELGRLEGFRIMEVVNAPTFASTTTVHAAIAVGAIKGWGSGELQSLRVYHVAPGGDHTDPLAQEELVGWKVHFGAAVLKNNFYYRVESGATAGL